MQYKDIVDVLFLPNNEEAIPDGVAYSEAVCEVRNGHLVDVFFTYSVDYHQQVGIGPLAKIVLDTDLKLIEEYVGLDNPRTFKLDTGNNETDVINALDTYEKLYPYIRSICAVKASIVDKRVIDEFIKGFLAFTNEEMRSIYMEISPDMFQYLKLITM